MKTFCIVLCAAVLLTSTPTFASHHEALLQGMGDVIPVTEMTPELFDAWLKGDRSDLTVACEEGTALPFRFLLRYRDFSLDLAPNLVFKVARQSYFRIAAHKLYVSYDLQNWEKFSPPAGVQSATKVFFSPDKSEVIVDTLLTESEDRYDEDDDDDDDWSWN